MLLVDFRSRVVVYWNWSWAFFTDGRGARLLTGDVHMQHTAATGTPATHEAPFIAAVTLCSLLTVIDPAPRSSTDIGPHIDVTYPQAETLYLDLHRHPELSVHEQHTAAKLAAACASCTLR